MSMKPLRILFVSHCYKPAWRVGGPAISVASLAEAMVRLGHEVRVLTTTFNFGDPLDVPERIPVMVDGVEVHYHPTVSPLRALLPWVPYVAKSMGFMYSSSLRSDLDNLVPSADLVHTHLPFIYPTLAASKVASRVGRPHIYHQRGVFDPARLGFRSFKKRAYISQIERPILSRATTLIALTEAEVTSYRALGVATPCRVIPNGIDTAVYRRQASPDWLAAKRWGDDDMVILFMGRLHPIKGADRLLDAFIQIADRHPKARLIMAGPDEFGIEETMRRLAVTGNFMQRIHFTGMVTGDEKLNLLARADIFCLPSDAEGFSMAVLEALASGTAILLSPGCHFPEAVLAGAGVESYPDPPVLAAALNELLSKGRITLAEMGERGRVLVERDYTWDRIAVNMEDCYREGLDRFHRGTTVGRRQ